MIQDYLDLSTRVIEKLSAIGFRLEVDTDYFAVFSNGSNWKIIFEGERYVRPAFDCPVQVSNAPSRSAGTPLSNALAHA